jgi:thermostable 8-oxoguanine DNA glycosylase
MTIAVLTLDNWIAADKRIFQTKKKYIHEALHGSTGIIDGVKEDNKEKIFYMLMFCLCVPQSKAIKAEEAIERLRKLNFYQDPLSLHVVVGCLQRLVRFQETKGQRLIDAKKMFLETDFWSNLERRYLHYISASDQQVCLFESRKYLIKTINGFGPKLASHFLRNVGMAGLAILDVHIIDGLKKRGIIDIEKLSASESQYLEIEQKMKDYAQLVGLTLDELDLLLWSQKTGYVFK